jgi:transcriptional regulator with XRE-family HTH domain
MRIDQIHERIKFLLDEYGLTKYRVTKESQLSRSGFYGMLDDVSVMPKLDTIQEFCDYINISIDDFFNWDNKERTSLSKFETEMVDLSKDLSVDNQKRVLAYIEKLKQLQEMETK